MNASTMFDLTGRRALVTGASRGLGKAMARGLKEAGAQVVLLSSSDSVKTAAAELDSDWVIADLADMARLESGFQQAVDKLGGLDIIINNAGITRRHKSEVFPLEDWQAVLDVNLTATFRLCQLAGNVMLAQGGGKIINIASMLSFFGGYTVPAYAASKGGVAQLTKALANEWACKNININAIAPGYMATDINVALQKDPVRSNEILSRIPAGRWGRPEDLIGCAVFLASHAADYVNGAVIPVDGGYLGR